MKYLLPVLLFPIAVFSQLNQNSLLPNVMPQNPQAYQFMKYGEIPVNEYTGTPEISIPLYTIEAKGLTVPINLTYHANGIQVSEEAGWVGLGWNLSTDMELVQTVMGLDDFGHYQYRMMPDFNCLIPLQAGGLSGASVMSLCGAFFLGHDDHWNDNHPSCRISESFTRGVWDSEPDIFYFSAAGYSGKFAMNWQNGQFICLTDKNIKIEAPSYQYLSYSGPASEFIITLPNGIKLYYNLKEETKINSSITQSDLGGIALTNTEMREEKSSRAYKITRIVTDQSDIIEFTYETTAASRNLPNVNLTNRNYTVMNSNGGDTFLPKGGLSTSFLATEQPFAYLSSIKLNDLTIGFVTSSRTDLKEAKKLDRIDIKYKNVVQKRFIFLYDYFTANTSGNNWDAYLNYYNGYYVTGKTADELSQRLRLNSVRVWDAGMSFGEKPYTFTYNTQALPKKTSYATDYWGFYNGKSTNTSFFENIYRFNVERDNRLYLPYEGNNKSPNLDFCKAGILERVTYPTGGYTQYDYQLHSFDNYIVPPTSQGETIQHLQVGTYDAPNQKVIITEGGNTFFKGNVILSTRGCPANTNAYLNCYVKIQQFKKELVAYVKSSSAYQQYGLMYALATMGLLTGSNTTLYNQYIESEQTFIKTYNDPEEKLIDLELNLKEGLIIATASGGCGTNNGSTNTSQAAMSLSYRDYKPLTGPFYGAGLRIDSVKTYSRDNILVYKKKYTYQGGKLMSPLVYFNKSVSREEYQQVYSMGTGCEFYNADLAMLNSQLQANLQRLGTNPTEANLNLVNQAYINMDLLSCHPNVISAINHFYGYRNELNSASFIQPSISASGRYVGYDKVTETTVSNNPLTPTITNGSIERYFINNPDEGAPPVVGAGNFTAINIPLTRKFPENGLLRKETLKDAANATKQETTNAYDYVQEPCLWGMKNMAIESFAEMMPGSPFVEIRNRYMDAVYPIQSGTTLLTKTQTTVYEDPGQNLSVKDFEYDSKNQVSKIKTENSNGDSIEILNKYIYDLPNDYYYAGIMDRNIIDRVMKRQTSVNGTVVSTENNLYKWVNTTNYVGSYYPARQQSGKTGNDADLEDRVIYYYYDDYGNPTEVALKDGARISYIWGYKGRYPVAKIENGTHDVTGGTINAALIAAVVNASDSGTEAQLLTALDNLRASVPDSRMTAYTYVPLVGVSTVTDPTGLRIKYTYDTLGRLVEVRDNEGKVLSATQYNFSH